MSGLVGSGFRNAFQSSLAIHCKIFLDETPSGDNVFVTNGPGFLDFWIFGFLVFMIFGFLDFWNSGFLDFRIFGFVDFWILGFLDFWILGFWIFTTSEHHSHRLLCQRPYGEVHTYKYQ